MTLPASMSMSMMGPAKIVPWSRQYVKETTLKSNHLSWRHTGMCGQMVSVTGPPCGCLGIKHAMVICYIMYILVSKQNNLVNIRNPPPIDHICFWFEGILGSAPGAEFSVSLSNHVGFTPRLLYSSTHHSPESFTHLKTG